MAVQACIKRDMAGGFDDDDDDDNPLVFRRKAASNQNQLNTEVKKSSSQKHDGQSGKQVPNIHSHNGQSSSAQKGKPAPSAKASPARSPVLSPKASTSSSPLASPVVNSKASVPLDNQSKHSLTQNTSSAVKEEKHTIKQLNGDGDDDDDSEDDKPLSARMKGNCANTMLKSSPHQSPPPKPNISLRNSPEDSDDEKPLSSRFSFKSNAGTSGKKPFSYDEKKPLLPKLQQNGLTMRDGQGKSSTVPSKRPLDKSNSSNQLVKKQKIMDSSESAKVKQVSVKAQAKADYDDDDDNIPIAQRMNKSVKIDNKSSSAKLKVKKVTSFKKTTKKNKKVMKKSKYSKSTKFSPSSGDGQRKWTTLVHSGVIFPPPYNSHGIKMLYNGKPVDLTPEQEEVATMFAVMKDTDYMQKDRFKENFWNDWRKILGKNHVIQNLEGCDFTPIYDWYQTEKEKKKQMSTEEKKAIKEEKLKQEEKYMWAIVDGVKEKVGNFRVEPPGLFRGRGEHPKMGKLKRRIHPSDITINIGKDAPVPECPIPGEKWKEIRHDNTVTWLAYWNDPINPREFKYVFLAASSSLKGQSDKEKYEKARMLKEYIENIRAAYTKNFTCKDVMKRQIAVATYLIDKLALRAGNEKDDDEADTVGCCTLKIENVTPLPDSYKLEFNFLGKDSIRYENVVEVEPLVYKAILQFQAGKKEGDDLFDKLNTSILNAHLKELMPGLTAKVFRTFNASITLDDMLFSETKEGDVAEKIAVYNYANKQVAIICNHQRSISKSHATQMTKLEEKLNDLKSNLKELRVDLDRAKKGKPPLKDSDGKPKKNLTPEVLEKKMAQINVKIEKTERDMKTKEDLKTVALGTSKINYLDPRITVAWCKRHEVPIEKMFNKSLLAKFAWSMDVEPNFRF